MKYKSVVYITVCYLLVSVLSVVPSHAQTCADRLTAIRGQVVTEQAQVTNERTQTQALLNKKVTSGMLGPITNAQTTTISAQAATIAALDAYVTAGCIPAAPPPALVLTPVTGQTFTSPDGNPVAVTYTMPVPSGGTPPYGTENCIPTEGSSFPVGTDGITCSITDNAGVSATTGVGSSPAFSIVVTFTSPPPPPPSGTWVNVTPSGVIMDPNGTVGGSSSNYGFLGAVVDTSHPGTFYTSVTYQGLWKSTDYGQTWAHVAVTSGLAPLDWGRGSLAIAPDGSYLIANSLYPAGGGVFNGAWKSTDGGQTWTRYSTGMAYDDASGFTIDPTNTQRVLGNAHYPPSTTHLWESNDGGQTWRDQGQAGGMQDTAHYHWVNDDVILAIDACDQGTCGETWRGVRTGTVWPWSWTWTHVDNQQGWHGGQQIFVDLASGSVWTGGVRGVHRSLDLGQTWTNVSSSTYSAGIIGTPSTLYSTANYASGGGFAPYAQHSARPTGSTWIPDTVPFDNGWVSAAVAFDGTNYIIVGGNWLAGLWRYVEPSGSAGGPPPPTTGQLAVSWDPVTTDDQGMLTTVTNYRVQYGTVSGQETATVETGGPITSLTLTPLVIGTPYYAVVEAYNGQWSSPSTEESAVAH